MIPIYYEAILSFASVPVGDMSVAVWHLNVGMTLH